MLHAQVKVLPPIKDIQRGPKRFEWIQYSAQDARATWNLHRCLKAELEQMEWRIGRRHCGTMMDFYNKVISCVAMYVTFLFSIEMA